MLYEYFTNRVASKRLPDFLISGFADPQVRRWYLTPWSGYRPKHGEPKRWSQWLAQKLPHVYLHHFLRSDDDRAHHDHPWFNVSILLHGYYEEHTIRAGGSRRTRIRRAGMLSGVRFRTPWSPHRIFLPTGQPCWTLFITGPVMRTWGFHCPGGFRPWREFVSIDGNSNDMGRGCEGLE